jgi:hypothetical protein
LINQLDLLVGQVRDFFGTVEILMHEKRSFFQFYIRNPLRSNGENNRIRVAKTSVQTEFPHEISSR